MNTNPKDSIEDMALELMQRFGIQTKYYSALQRWLTKALEEVREEAYKAGYIKGGLDEQMTLNPTKIREETKAEIRKALPLKIIPNSSSERSNDMAKGHNACREAVLRLLTN